MFDFRLLFHNWETLFVVVYMEVLNLGAESHSHFLECYFLFSLSQVYNVSEESMSFKWAASI